MIDRNRLQVLPVDAWADHVAAELSVLLAARPGLRIGMPTGATPRSVYEALPNALQDAGTDFGRANVVLLDEYLGLAAGDPARCDGQLRRQLIDRLEPPPARMITFDVDNADPLAACAAFSAALDSIGGLDLMLLGLGMNGHVGMNEPGSGTASRTRPVALADSTIDSARGYGAGQPPSQGVTLGMAEILAAGEIWLLVTGRHKADILARVLAGPPDERLPASLLLGHAGLRVMVDSEAAG